MFTVNYNSIYLDNAATSFPKPKSVVDAVTYALLHGANPGRAGHKMAIECAENIFNTRENIKNLINADKSKKIAFTKNCTEALNILIFGSLKDGDHVITSVLEHNSILRPLEHLKNTRNISVSYVSPKDENSHVTWEDIEPFLQKNTKMIALSHASNLSGVVLNAEKIGRNKPENVLFLLDVAQSLGHLEMDVEKFGVDLLAAAGHKGLLGPMGTGFLYVRDENLTDAFMMGGTGSKSTSFIHPNIIPDKYEAGTLNYHGILGLNAGIEEINRIGISNIKDHIYGLSRYFKAELKKLNGVRIIAPDIVSSNVCINIGDMDSGLVSYLLDDKYDIYTRSQIHCAPKAHEFYNTLDQGLIRFGIGFYNTLEEIDRTLYAIDEIRKENGIY